ncbi:MAG: PulJ/GspJ family protein [Bdellovibrionales bacterium]
MVKSGTQRSLESGQALIQVLIATAILSIILQSTMTMFSSSQTMQKQLTQKIASLDLDRIVNTTLSDIATCNFAVTHPAPASFDGALVGTKTPPTFAVTSVPASGKPGSTLLLDTSSTVPPMDFAPTLVVKSIDVIVLACVTPPCTGPANEFTGNLRVFFDGTKTVTPLAPLQFPIKISTAGAGLQTVSSCLPTSSGGGGGGGNAQVFSRPGTYTFTVPNSFKSMTVVVTGAGGAGASLVARGSNPSNPGTAGGASSFNGALIGGGGGGGVGYAAGGYGADGAPGTATGGDGNVPGGAANGGTGAIASGNAAHNGGPGGYAYKTYSSSDIAPGSAVTVQVGAAGVQTVTGAMATQAGPVGAGHVEIIWQ